jgi:hypothetical protein
MTYPHLARNSKRLSAFPRAKEPTALEPRVLVFTPSEEEEKMPFLTKYNISSKDNVLINQ